MCFLLNFFQNELSILLHEKDEIYQKTNRKLQAVCQELMKANGVIKNMHNENNSLKNEVRPIQFLAVVMLSEMFNFCRMKQS